jgi:hypothetical protein
MVPRRVRSSPMTSQFSKSISFPHELVVGEKGIYEIDKSAKVASFRRKEKTQHNDADIQRFG